MFRKIPAFLSLAIAAMLLPCNAHALLWGLLGNDDQWRTQDPRFQSEQASPIMDKALELEQEGRLSNARSMYEKVWKKYPASDSAAEALYHSGKISMKMHKWKAALKAYNVLVQAYPESSHFNDVISDYFEIAGAYEEGRDIHYLWFFKYKDKSKAVQVYETIVQVAPYSDYAPISLMRVAMLHRRDRLRVQAIDTLDRIINNYPNSMTAADATLLLADFLSMEVDGPEYDQGATRESMSYYRDFTTLYPNNPAIKEAEEGIARNRETYAQSKLILGEFFFNYRDDYSSAAVFFNDTITIAPESKSADKAREYIAIIDQIKERFPDESWPVRKDWQYLFFWRKWDPLSMPAPEPKEAPAETAAK